MKITKEKLFYKTMLAIAIPIGIQNLVTFMVSMADTIMLGSLGEIPLSASSIGNNLFFILMVLMFGVSSGASVMTSQYYGKGDIKSIHKIMAIMYKLCIIIALIFVLIALFIPEEVMSIFTTDELVINDGASYLRIVCIGYIFFAVTNCTIGVLRTTQTVNISMVVYTISLVVNVFFNWIFIFGNLGMKPMGVQGAALGTVIARITEFIILIIYMKFFERKLNFKGKYLRIKDSLMKKDFRKNCTPVVINDLLWALGSTMISVIVGRMGTEVVAGNSISQVFNQLVTVFIFGISSATSVIIGNTIGEGKLDKVKEYANTIIILATIVGIISGLVVYNIRDFVVDFYNVSQTTKIIAKDIMLANSIIVVFVSLASNTMMGILRGGGDNKFVLINDVIYMWIVSIPIGFIAAFVWRLPIVLVFFILKIDEVLKVIASIFRILSNNWINNVTRENNE